MKRTAFEGTFTFAGSSLAVLYKEGCLRVVCPVDLAERIIELAERDEGIRASLSWLEGEMQKRPAAKVLLDGVDHQPYPNGAEAGHLTANEPCSQTLAAPPDAAPFDEHEAPLEHPVDHLPDRCTDKYLGTDGQMWRCGGWAGHIGQLHGCGVANTQSSNCFPERTSVADLPRLSASPHNSVDVRVMPTLPNNRYQFCACARQHNNVAFYLESCPNHCNKGVN